METSITSEKKILLSNINSLDRNHLRRRDIPVKRSDDERCIYKVLELKEDVGIYIDVYEEYVHSSSFLSKSTYQKRVGLNIYGFNPPHENWKKRFDEEAIELIVDINVSITGDINKNGYKAIYMKDSNVGGNKYEINMEHYMQNGGTIEELPDGSFKSKLHGVLFPIKIYQWEIINDRANSIHSILNAAVGIYGGTRDMEFPGGIKQKEKLVLKEIEKKELNFTFDLKMVEGVNKTLAVIKPFFEKAAEEKETIFGLAAFIELIESTKRTINSVKFSVIFNKIFSAIKTQEEFNTKLNELAVLLEERHDQKINTTGKEFPEYVLDSLPEAREIKKAAIKRKSTGAINKIMDDLDFISIDKDKYPLTHEAIFSGDIPKGTFFRKNGDSYFVYNDNWEIWERMLALHRDVAIEIASEASRRTTFEKDIMSYFFFVLEKLPNYLERHTGKTWKCFPKLISAERELDPPTEGDNGVSKSRSALTPIVDNEKGEVVVPYVSMRLSGYQTTYCYGLDYNVLERGLSFNGNTITKEVEMLNGRDNYGLMFYTLTGSAQAQGYPTFLIIFEDLSDGSNKKTHVHFHRTHPMRSKGGDYNPIHGWILGCFKWMVGNVNYERVKAQQGDLVFVQMTSPIEEGEFKFQEVNAFDSHKFESPVKFIPYMKKEKSNILGYFRIENDMMLNHAHHKARFIPAGDYELRQCRSWEANPKGVWSLRID